MVQYFNLGRTLRITFQQNNQLWSYSITVIDIDEVDIKMYQPSASVNKRRGEGKYQESIQSSTTIDAGHHMGN